jgi:hypothetical protein
MLHAYIINLDTRLDRLENGIFQFLQCGFHESNIHRVRAVDTRAETYETFKAKLPGMTEAALDAIRLGARMKGHNELTRGSIGCHLSHRKAWTEICANPSIGDEEIVLIAEDDLDFHDENVRKRMRMFAVDSPWSLALEMGKSDVLLLGHFGSEIKRKLGLYLYALRKATAARLLQIVPEAPRQQIDWELNQLEDEGAIRIGVVRKCIAVPLHAGTDVQSSEPCVVAWSKPM